MKDLYKKNAGFTLVEIIVSIAIFSAVLAVLGSVIVSGFKYFYQTSSTDLNKQSADELIGYIRDELLYSTDVRLVNSKPEGDWYSFSVVDGVLKQYEEKEGAEIVDLNLFNNKSFYNNNNLRILVKAYENKNRLDIRLSLYDDKETLYTTRDTLELFNIEAIQEAPFADEQEIGLNQYKIYYKKSTVTLNNNDNNNNDNNEDSFQFQSGHGTVDAIREVVTGKNYRGIFVGTHNYYGDEVVWYNNHYWQKIPDIENTNAPGASYGWKRLTREYSHENQGSGPNNKDISAYEEGDIIVYPKRNEEGKLIDYYFQAAQNMFNESDARIENPDGTISSLWEVIGPVGDSSAEQRVNLKEYTLKEVYNQETICSRFFPTKEGNKLDITDPTYPTIDLYEPNKTYKNGDIIKVKSSDPNYYYLYIQRLETSAGNIGDPKNGWTRIDVAFDSGSYYEKGDIVMLIGFNSGGALPWVKANQNILVSQSVSYIIQNIWNNSKWNVLYG
ncbi:pilus assembly FimT family protein [Longibaculum muris]|uniref:pilus assembly FimT family protein n=1 Tax=Longibaculum muris TaxID=1796628 RepID=UPI0022E2EDBF|nr:prepilin-type N-terminal cleavage/methylation domain-containing protein [Longibaculum muris]